MSEAWKSTEREYASIFGGVRQPRTGGKTVDILHPWLALEIKHRTNMPEWFYSALEQIENSDDAGNKFRVVVWHKKRQPFLKGVIQMRVEDFLELLEYIDVDKVMKERKL